MFDSSTLWRMFGREVSYEMEPVGNHMNLKYSYMYTVVHIYIQKKYVFMEKHKYMNIYMYIYMWVYVHILICIQNICFWHTRIHIYNIDMHVYIHINI
jgi:hypothetical protein